MICVTTRFRLKHPWNLVTMLLALGGMRRDLRIAPGLIRFAFLLESPLVCCTLSIWESEAPIMAFTNTRSHLSAVRRAKRVCTEIWSAYWRIDRVSEDANVWEGRAPWPELVPGREHPGPLMPLPVKGPGS